MNTSPFQLAPTVSALALVLITSSHAATVFVDDDAPFDGDGATWKTAYRFLSDGLAAAAPNDIIKVGAGTHRPDESAEDPDGSGDITLSFTVNDGQQLRGGYAGYGALDPDERDLDLYPTTLSGDLDDDDQPDFLNRDDNSRTVVDLDDRIDVILDGLTIRGGHEEDPLLSGSGIHSASGSVTIRQCRIIDNWAVSGAGLSANDSDIEIEDSEFRGNRAAGDPEGIEANGGGIRSASGTVTLRRCRIIDNWAVSGAGLSAIDSEIEIEDCEFRGNRAMGDPGGVGPNGGGFRSLSGIVTIRRCRIIDNVAGSGAGLSVFGCEIEIEDCEFRGNHAAGAGAGGTGGAGGAVRASDESSALVHRSVFHDNVGGVGGAIYMNAGGTAVLTDNVFQGNLGLLGGGAVALIFQISINVLQCDFESNTGDVGGGMIADGNRVTVQDSTFANNSSSFFGGGATVSGGLATITNCLFSRNRSSRAAGIYVVDSTEIVNCSFSRNDGQALQAEGPRASATIHNSILWGNTPVQVQGLVFISDSCVEGGYGGGTNIDEDPLFVQAGTDNLRLSAGSPCLDVGNNDAIPPGITHDLAGNPRIANGTVDMGCYEGVFAAMPEAASINDLDQGDVAILPIAGAGWDPLHQTTLVVVNHAGEDNASLLVTVLDQPGPVPGGFSVNGAVIQIETDGINDGEFSVQIFTPIDPALLGGADPLRLDVTRLHDTSVWSLAVAANSVNSPDQIGPIGDRRASLAPEPMIPSGQMGDYGVWWDEAAQEGLAWSNVDRQGTYALGVPLHPADCLQPPNDFVDFHDLLFVIGYWGAGAGPFDVDDSGEVGLPDLVEVLSHWGACP